MAASASDAHPFPIYNARFRVIFPLLDADGDLVTGAATPDSEISQDCGTFADATNEMTEIATSSGIYYLDLVAGELDTKSTAIIAKSATAGMKTTPIILYPVRLPVIRTGTAQAGSASSITLDSGASAITDYYVGCYVNITNDSPSNAQGQARKITAYDGSTKVATVEGTYGTNPSSASTFEILATAEWTFTFADTRAFGGAAGTFASGRPEVNTTHLAGTSQTARDIGASVLLSNGTGTGQVKLSSGYVAPNWGDVGNPSTVLNLSGTTIKNVTDLSDRLYGLVAGFTTIATLASQTSFTVADGAVDNDALNGCLVVIYDSLTSNQYCIGVISDYVGSTKTVTLAADPGIFTMAVGDIVYFTTMRAPLQPTVLPRTLDVSATGEAGVDWGNIGSPTTAQNLSGTNIDPDQIVASVTGAVGSVTNAVTLTNPQGIKKNTAHANFEFVMFDDQGEPATGLTVVEERSIDGGAYAACANAFSEISHGTYKIDLASTDLNGDIITFKFSATGAKTTYVTVKTVQA